MKNSLALLATLFFSSLALASTFVGNGGNAGDLDLAITLTEIKRTFQSMDHDLIELCTCPDSVADNKICSVLDSLTDPQVEFCRNILFESRKDIIALAGRDSDVRFEWSDEPLQSDDGRGATRIVDAIAQPNEKRIIVARQRFLSLPSSYRIALITHELFHLVNFTDGPITDGERIDPFPSGRHLLDALGAATARAAHEYDIIWDFRTLEDVSRGYKKFRVGVELKTISHESATVRKLLTQTVSTGAALVFEYKPSNWGLAIEIESTRNASKFNGTFHVEESSTLFTLGVSRHWFPFDEFLSRWNEMHLSLGIEGLAGDTRYRVYDDYLTISDGARKYGGQLSGRAHVPLVNGLWGTLGYQLRMEQYQYRSLGISIREFQSIVLIGGAYAF